MNVLKFAFAFMAIPLLANCGSVSHKISFNGTNCSLYDSSGKLIEGSVNVKDGTSVDYVFHVEDEEQFSVPNEVDIVGKIKEYTYDADTGALKISKINSDLVITANAVTNVEVTYSNDQPEIFTWEGPTKIGLNKKLTAKVNILNEKYWIDPDNLLIYIDGNRFENYSFVDNVLMIDGKYITGKVSAGAAATKISYGIHFIGDEHCDVDSTYHFNIDDWSGFYVDCPFEDPYTIGQISVEPKNALQVDFNSNTSLLNVIPMANCSSTVRITSAKKEKFTLDSSVKSLDITNVFYTTSNVNISIGVSDTVHYIISPKPSDFKILDENGKSIAFTFERISDYMAYLTINRDLLVSDVNYTIRAFDYKVKFDVTNGLEDSLVSEDLPQTAERGENLNFTLKIGSTGNAEADIIPYTLDITYADGTKMPKDAYKIDADANRQNADVTIYKEYINKDFEISGKPIQYNYFEYEMFGFGVDFQNHTDEGYIYNFASQTVTTEIKLTGDNLRFLGNDRIIIEDEDGNCYRLSDADLPDEYKCISLVVEGSGAEEYEAKLVLDKPTFDYIVVYISIPDYEFFSKLSWNTIDMFSQKGWASTFFKVGQTKELIYEDITYDVRIIGFNHDDLATEEGEGKAGITLEFVQLITNQDGSLYKGKFSSDDSGSYSDSNYCTYLQEQFFPGLPNEITGHIKKVKKTYAIWLEDPDTLETKIFPLSLKELNLSHEYAKKEGSTYAYYNGADKSVRRKSSVGSSSYSSYWTRSMYYMHYNGFAFAVNSSGELSDSEAKDSNKGYTAAFCI